MKTIAKFFLVMALFTGSVWAGDQPNGGRTGCTENCPPPCTENCDQGDGLYYQEDVDLTTESSAADGDSLDSVRLFVADLYQMIL